MGKYSQLIEWIKNSRSTVFFGGAGVSTESGIPDFRSQDGLYHQKYAYPPEEIISHSFFMHDTEEFYRFYKDRMIYEDAKPNRTHKVLVEMEKKGLCDAVITQNIDGLHQAAGSKNVIELHGSVLRNTCMRCGKKYDLNYVMEHEGVPRCEKCGGIVKPDVVLYEEGLNEEDIENAIRAIEEAEVLIIGGTSLVVYPAAGMIRYYRGNKLVLINRSSTPYDNYANLVFHDSLGNVFEEIGKEL